MAMPRSRPRGREIARPPAGGVATEHAAKIYGAATASVVVLVAFLALTSAGHVIDAATQHFMLFYAGVFTLIALCASVALGLIATDRMFLHPGHRIFIQSAHRAASFGAVAFLLIHIATEILAQRVHLLDSVVPFLSPYRTFYIGLGTIASDLILLIAITGIIRKRFTAHGKAWRWRAIHYTSYLAFVFGVWHGLLGGRPGKPYVDWSYGFVVAFVALGLAVRILANSLHPKETLSSPPVPESASSGSAPMRAAAMFAQLGVVRAATSTALLAQSGPQPMLSAPVGDWDARDAASMAPAIAALPAAGAPYGYQDDRQPYYEPGYEGPPRYLGAPRADSGPMPRADSGPMPRVSSRQGQVRDSGPMPRVPTGPMPQASGSAGDWGAGPMPRAASGPMPRATGAMPPAAGRPVHRADSGPMPRAATGPMPRAATGPMPMAAGGPMPGPATGPMPMAAGGPMPGAATGPTARPASGPNPRAATGAMRRAANGAQPRTAAGPIPDGRNGPVQGRRGGPMQSAMTGPVPRAGTGPMPEAPYPDPRSVAGAGPRTGTGPRPRAANLSTPRAGTGPAPSVSGGRGARPGGSQPRDSQPGGGQPGRGRHGARSARGQAQPAGPGWAGAEDWAGPQGPADWAGEQDWTWEQARMEPQGWTDGQEWTDGQDWTGAPGWSAVADGQAWYSGQPPWEGGIEPDPSFRYRPPGPGMPGYRGPRGPFYGGDDLP